MKKEYVMKKYNLEELNESQLEYLEKYKKNENVAIGSLVAVAIGTVIFDGNMYASYGLMGLALCIGLAFAANKSGLKKKLLELKD